MSGLVGIVGPRSRNPSSATEVGLMARAMARAMEAPAQTHECTVEREGARLAWVQRADNGDCAAWNSTRDVFLVFHGRDFDLEEKARALRSRGLAFQTEAECLLHCYEAEGEAFVPTLNGRFSGLIIDRRKAKVLLFNDRFGAGRVYVRRSPDGLAFASEAKALLAAFPELRRVDPRGLGEFLSLGCVLQDRTLFPDVTLLPPGSLWTLYPDGRVEQRRYFSPESWEQQTALEPEEFCEQLTQLFSRIVPRYHREAGSVAMSMTGGLDSRMILAWAKTTPGELPCYTFGGPYRDCADVRIARRLSGLAGQPHRTIPIGPDFFPQFLALARRTVELSDGTMDVSGAVELYANRLAKDLAPIRLTGNYGSEILRANVAFRPRSLDPSLFAPEFRPQLEAAAETYRGEAAGHRLSFIAFKQVPWHHHARLSVEAAVLEPRSPFLDNALVALAYRTPAAWQGSAVPALRTTAAGNPAFAAVPTDRAVRLKPVPVFGAVAHRWQEFTAKVEYAWDYGMPSWLVGVVRPFRPLHPERLFLGRHKFYHFRTWYREQLADALSSLPLDFNHLPACYAAGVPRHLVETHVAGRANRTLDLHRLLTLHFIDRQISSTPCSN
ncbi:MAG: asparagine synthase-related protein [Opitutaceae bacterium]|nr:asparagine synthase-related protein [Opitutaceae bacterium]